MNKCLCIFSILFISLVLHANDKSYQDGLNFGAQNNGSLFSTFDDPELKKDIPHYETDNPDETNITEDDFVPLGGNFIDTNADANFVYDTSNKNYRSPYEIEHSLLTDEKEIRDNADEIADKPGYCDDGECFEYEEEPNDDFASSTTVLMAAFEGGTGNDNPNVDIFMGKGRKCQKNKFGNTNCCKLEGWGKDVGLSNCDEEEEKLAELRNKGYCIKIGRYDKKSTLGFKKKYESYCCFDSKLGLATQRDGRPQIGKPWGKPKHPNCSGFTITEYEMLDYSKIDLSDAFAETEKQYAEPDHKSPDTIAKNHTPHDPEDIKTW